jgi:hypothetical protein
MPNPKLKYLDLDAIHRPTGRIKILDKEYDVYPISVKALINLAMLNTVDEENMSDAEAAENVEKAMNVLGEIFPACPRGELDKLSMPQINALIEFCNSLGDEAVEKNSEAPTKKK